MNQIFNDKQSQRDWCNKSICFLWNWSEWRVKQKCPRKLHLFSSFYGHWRQQQVSKNLGKEIDNYFESEIKHFTRTVAVLEDASWYANDMFFPLSFIYLFVLNCKQEYVLLHIFYKLKLSICILLMTLYLFYYEH